MALEAGCAPRSQLPGWARAGLAGLKRAEVSGTLHRDRTTPLPSIKAAGNRGTRSREEGERVRVAQLERSIVFLKQQHVETLQQLHSETERLKRENRELSFRLIMCRCGRSRTGSRCRPHHQPSPVTEADTPTDELRVLFLQEEAGQLRQALAEERRRNGRMLQLLQSRLQDTGSSHVPESKGGQQEKEGGGRPSYQDYEATIEMLRRENKQKAHELTQIKADLRDILFSHKWSPAAYLQARAYVPGPLGTEGEGEGGAGQSQVFKRVQQNVQLPALRPHLQGGVAERQRRRQAVQGRPLRAGLPPLHPP